MEKLKFEEAEVEVVKFSSEDILTTSGKIICESHYVYDNETMNALCSYHTSSDNSKGGL